MAGTLRTWPDAAVGLLVASCATLLINLPLWHGLLLGGEAARPDVVIESSDEKFYLARISEVASGHPWAGHPFLYERRDQRYPLGNLWEVMLGLPMRWLDLEIKTVAIAADAVFPMLLVFLLWMGTRPLLPDYRWRMLLIGILYLGFEMHWWKRPISPQQTMILPLLYLWAALTPRRAELIPTGIRGALIGLMTLSYPFHWTFCLATEGLLTLLHWRRDPRWSDRLRRLGAVSIPLALCALPWIMMMLSIQGDEAYAQTLARLGLLDRRLPSGLPLQAFTLFALAATWWAYRRTNKPRVAEVPIILLLASLAVLNQPLITGKEAEFSSHYRQIIVFPLWIALLWTMNTLLRTQPLLLRTLPLAGLLIIGIRTAQALDVHWQHYDEARLDTAAREQRTMLMAALGALSGERVILTERDVALDMAVYTEHYPFFAHETHMYLTDDDEIWHRAAIQRALLPKDGILPRSVAGSSFLNRALHERTTCQLRSLLTLSRDRCDVPPETYLPERWQTLSETQPAREEIVAALRDAGTDYALMRELPDWLRSYGSSAGMIGDYELFRFDWSSPLPNRE